MARRRLTHRQIERIGQRQARRRQELTAQAEADLATAEAPGTDPDATQSGRVVTCHGAHLAVMDATGRIHHCLSRQHLGQPVCGDQVVWQPTGPGQGVATALLERRTLLSRPDHGGRDKPLAANISQLVVVLAPQPEPVDYLLDQYLVAAERLGVAALLTLNKLDLLNAPEAGAFLERFARYERIGYGRVPVSAQRDRGLAPLAQALAGQVSILVGQSGVGKSSLVKALLPDLDIQIGRLSQATGLGRHTTAVTTWYQLPGGGALIDSPGVRSFRLGPLSFAALERGFREFHAYLGRCQFGDCRHDREPGCALKAALERGDITPERLASFRHMASRLGDA